MGNTTSIRNLQASEIAHLLHQENPAYEAIAVKLYNGDQFLSLIGGNYLLSLDFREPSDQKAFESILDSLDIQIPFVRKSLEHLLRQTQHQSVAHDFPWVQSQYPACGSPPDPTYPAPTPTATTSIHEEDSHVDKAATPATATGDKPSTATPKTSVAPRPARSYADVAAKAMTSTTTTADCCNTYKKNEVEIFDVATQDGSNSLKQKMIGNRLGLVQLDKKQPYDLTQTLVWNNSNSYPNKIILEEYTQADWARHVVPNTLLTALEQSTTAEIATLLCKLGTNREAIYGRFFSQTPSVTGVVVISYRQSMNARPGQLECCIHHHIPDCPLQPLGGTAPLVMLTAEAPSFRPSLSVSANFSATSKLITASSSSSLSLNACATSASEKPSTGRATATTTKPFPSSTSSSLAKACSATVVQAKPATMAATKSALLSTVALAPQARSLARALEAAVPTIQSSVKPTTSLSTSSSLAKACSVKPDFSSTIGVTWQARSHARPSKVAAPTAKTFASSPNSSSLANACAAGVPLTNTPTVVAAATVKPLSSSLVSSSLAKACSMTTPTKLSAVPGVTTSSSPTTVMLPPSRPRWGDDEDDDENGQDDVAYSNTPEVQRFDHNWEKIQQRPVHTKPAATMTSTPRSSWFGDKFDIADQNLVQEAQQRHFKFRLSLEQELEDAFALSPQKSSMEVCDLWSKVTNGCAFDDLSTITKEELLLVIYQAVRIYNNNHGTQENLVIRKGTFNVSKLHTVMIFKSEAAAKQGTLGFRKTKTCCFWAKGQCTSGNECRFAHGQQELRSAEWFKDNGPSDSNPPSSEKGNDAVDVDVPKNRQAEISDYVPLEVVDDGVTSSSSTATDSTGRVTIVEDGAISENNDFFEPQFTTAVLVNASTSYSKTGTSEPLMKAQAMADHNEMEIHALCTIPESDTTVAAEAPVYSATSLSTSDTQQLDEIATVVAERIESEEEPKPAGNWMSTVTRSFLSALDSCMTTSNSADDGESSMSHWQFESLI